jgi:hypothetical protein
VIAEPAFEAPRDLDWRSWRAHETRMVASCKCKEHTYQRWSDSLAPVKVLPTTRAGEKEQSRMNLKLAEVAAGINEIFKLVPDSAWPKCQVSKR